MTIQSVLIAVMSQSNAAFLDSRPGLVYRTSCQWDYFVNRTILSIGLFSCHFRNESVKCQAYLDSRPFSVYRIILSIGLFFNRTILSIGLFCNRTMLSIRLCCHQLSVQLSLPAGVSPMFRQPIWLSVYGYLSMGLFCKQDYFVNSTILSI